MTKIAQTNEKKKINPTKIVILSLLFVAILMVLIVLCIDAYGTKKVNFVSAQYPYSIEYDTSTYEYVRQALDSNENYVERFQLKSDEMNCYVGVYGIDDSVDIDEALEAFQSDGSYEFTVEEGATYGANNYTATKISYTDTSEDVPLNAAYYYDIESGIIVAVCSVEGHEEEISQMLGSIRITD